MSVKLNKLLSKMDSMHDLLLFSQIYIFITFLPLLLRIFSLSRLMRILTTNTEFGNKSVELSKSNKTILFTDIILNRNFWIYKNNCLKRALTLYYFLRKQKYEVQIFYGVKKEDSGTISVSFSGHAWLVYDGAAFAQNDTSQINDFAITYRYPF